ncbi:MAG: AraC family transcriptional regulator [Timaviella obliquedivisa GSE-PSE-MK23-08B]|jgi:AraC-like DNA-binding protein|nr:AraC family transcriptional regulator [Timaviella obliquedivisa GSE-PSE-MK23-08B]
MAIALSQSDYWALFQEPLATAQMTRPDKADTIWKYPEQFGQGYWRSLQLQEGLLLEIGDYQLHKPLIVESPERAHPLECSFWTVKEFVHQPSSSDGEYFFSGSGNACEDSCEYLPGQRNFEVCVHMEPELFCASVSDRAGEVPEEFQKLLKKPDQERFVCSHAPTAAMQITLQQIVNCPHQGAVKRMYLESKVWELMALQLEAVNQQANQGNLWQLKAEDVDRLHYAREILAKHLQNPPSLKALARQVGLNEFILKRGFRQVFSTTVFGYLHQYRMEQAKQLLEEGNLSITQIAHAVGFANRGYFAAAFRKRFGINPKAYSLLIGRQRNLGDAKIPACDLKIPARDQCDRPYAAAFR